MDEVNLLCFPKLLLEIEELDKSIPKFNLLESNNLEKLKSK